MARQLFAGAVGNFGPRCNRQIHLIRESPKVADRIREQSQPRHPIADLFDHPVRAPGGPKRLRGFDEITRFEHLANCGRADRRTNVVRARERHVDAHLVDGSHLCRLQLQFIRSEVVRLRPHRQGKLAPNAERCFVREQRQHFAKLKHPQGMVVHVTSVERLSRRGQRIRISHASPVCFAIEFG